MDRLKVREVLELIRSYYPNPMELSELVRLTGLGDSDLNRYAERLSGGQKRSLGFALALAGNPELVFFDEPTVGLDITARRRFWDSVRQLADQGKTIVFTTHYLQEADDIADRVLLFYRGSLVADGTPEAIKSRIVKRSVSFLTDGDGSELRSRLVALSPVAECLFAVTYRQLYWVTGRTFNLWLALQLGIILALCAFYSPYNFYMGFFTSNFIGWSTDHKKFNVAISCFAAVEVLSLLIGSRDLLVSDLPFLLPFLLIMLVMPYGIRSMARRQHLEQELDRANEQIKELIKRGERMRIARDLHDTLGHTLSLITLKSQLVEKLASKDAERAQVEAREIQRTSRAALRQVRELVSDMRAVTVVEALAEAGEILRAADIPAAGRRRPYRWGNRRITALVLRHRPQLYFGNFEQAGGQEPH